MAFANKIVSRPRRVVPSGAPPAASILAFAAASFAGLGIASVDDAIIVTRASAGLSSTTSGALSAFAANAPRMTNRGLLIEPPVANKYSFPDDISNAAWTKAGGTVDAVNIDPAADGSNTFRRFTPDTTTGDHSVMRSVSSATSGTTAGGYFAVSFQCKPSAGLPYIQLSIDAANGSRRAAAIIDLANKRIINYASSSSNQPQWVNTNGRSGSKLLDAITITDAPNGSYRVMARMNNGSNTSIRVYVAPLPSSVTTLTLSSGSPQLPSYTGDGASYFNLSELNLVTGTYAPNYINSTTAQAADVVSASPALLAALNSPNVTVLIETSAANPSPESPYRSTLLGISTAAGDYEALRLVGQKAVESVIGSQVIKATLGSGIYGRNTVRTVLRNTPTGRSICANGGPIAKSGTKVPEITAARLLQDMASASFAAGRLVRIQIWTKALSDNEMLGASKGLSRPDTVPLPNLSAPTLSNASIARGSSVGTIIGTFSNLQGGQLEIADGSLDRFARNGNDLVVGSAGITGNDASIALIMSLTKNGFGNSPLLVGYDIDVTGTIGARQAGLSYTPSYVPVWTGSAGTPGLYRTRAELLAAIGKAASATVDYVAGGYTSFKAFVDACVASGKPGTIGRDNGTLTISEANNRITWDWPIYGYGSDYVTLNLTSRGAFLHPNIFDVTMRSMRINNAGTAICVAAGTQTLARPDQTGYDPATSAGVAAPYHTGNDALNLQCIASVDAGFMMKRCGSIRVTGNPTFSSLKPERQKADPGPAAGRGYYDRPVYAFSALAASVKAAAYFTTATFTASCVNDVMTTSAVTGTIRPGEALAATGSVALTGTTHIGEQLSGPAGGAGTYRISRVQSFGSGTFKTTLDGNSLFTDAGPNAAKGNGAWKVQLDTAAPDLLAAPLANATAASLAAAINANSGVSGYSAVVDPYDSARCIITNTDRERRPFAWVIASTGGTVTWDTQGPNIDVSYCEFNGGDLTIAGTSSVTRSGRIIFCKNKGRGTWGQICLDYPRWSEVYRANNDWGDCLKVPVSGGAPLALGRSASSGNAMPSGSNQSPKNTVCLLGKNNHMHHRYQKAQGGTKVFSENNRTRDVESLNDTDTVNCAVDFDCRQSWEFDPTIAREQCYCYNDVFNMRGLAGAIDCNVVYFKGGWLTFRGNRIVGFGAKRTSGVRPGIRGGSESAGLTVKNAGDNYDFRTDLLIESNYLEAGPNGLPWIKTENIAEGIRERFNHLKGPYFAQLDDAIAGDASTYVGPQARFTGSCAPRDSSTSLVTVDMVEAGSVRPGQRFYVIGGASAVIKSQASGVSGGAGTYIVDSKGITIAAGTTMYTDYRAIRDGGLVRHTIWVGNIQLVGNKFEDIWDYGYGAQVLLHEIQSVYSSSFGSRVLSDVNLCEVSNNIAINPIARSSYDGTTLATVPIAYTGDKQLVSISMDGGNFASLNTMKIGRNKTKNAAGTNVGNATMRYSDIGVVYGDNNNTVDQPFVPL